MIIAGVCLFFTGIIVIICYPINKKKNARCSMQTQGVLSDIRIRFDSEGMKKSKHVYTYSVDGVEYKLETVDHSLEVNDIGDSCTIWYNPKKPQDTQAFRGSDKYLKILLYAGLAAVLLGIVLIVAGF
jgi:hypothetical protein